MTGSYALITVLLGWLTQPLRYDLSFNAYFVFRKGRITKNPQKSMPLS